MITTLENLTEKVQQNRLKNLGENIVKYQYFKTTQIIKIIDNAGFKENTLRSYVNSGINYINTGKKFKQYGNFYQYIDDAINRFVQPLTPKNSQKRQLNVKQNTILPVQNVLKKLNEKVEPQSKIAVQLNNNLSIVNDEKEAIGFNKCLEFLGKQAGKIVKIVIEEI